MLVITGGNTTVRLEFLEETFDKMPFLIRMPIN